MGYKSTYGETRTSGIMKTKELAGKSSLFNLGKTNPINHVTDFEHSPHEGQDRYTREVPVKPGTNRQSRSARKKLSKQIANVANTPDADGQTVNTQGYMRGGKQGSIKLFNNGNIVNASTGTRGGGAATGTSFSDSNNQNVNWRDVRSQLKETGSVTVKNGKISTGTTQTKTTTGSAKRDAAKKTRATKIETRRNELKNRKARVEGERARALLEKKEARENKKTNKK